MSIAATEIVVNGTMNLSDFCLKPLDTDNHFWYHVGTWTGVKNNVGTGGNRHTVDSPGNMRTPEGEENLHLLVDLSEQDSLH